MAILISSDSFRTDMGRGPLALTLILSLSAPAAFSGGAITQPETPMPLWYLQDAMRELRRINLGQTYEMKTTLEGLHPGFKPTPEFDTVTLLRYSRGQGVSVTDELWEFKELIIDSSR